MNSRSLQKVTNLRDPTEDLVQGNLSLHLLLVILSCYSNRYSGQLLSVDRGHVTTAFHLFCVTGGEV